MPTACLLKAAITAASLGLVLHGRAAAEPLPVDLELVLAVDVSWSMDYDEQALQRSGYVAALRDPLVIDAITGGGWGRIALTYVEWAGTSLQHTVVPWRLVDSETAAREFADSLEAAPIGRLRRTSISGALQHGAHLFDINAFGGLRRVIDISGDGANNQGPPVTVLRDRLVAEGIVINGLPVMIKTSNPSGYFNVPDLDIYYEDCVIGGPGAFALTVTDPHRFATAIRQKLILEIAGPVPAPDTSPARIIPAQLVAGEPRIDCLIGEKNWRRWRRMRDNEW